jgi:hypothetical protein
MRWDEHGAATCMAFHHLIFGSDGNKLLALLCLVPDLLDSAVDERSEMEPAKQPPEHSSSRQSVESSVKFQTLLSTTEEPQVWPAFVATALLDIEPDRTLVQNNYKYFGQCSRGSYRTVKSTEDPVTG